MGLHMGIRKPGGIDSDAAAFISAAGITDDTQESALNTLVQSLKSAGIWSKMAAIYPFIGGSAAAHKWNLKDPRDLDAAYRLVFINNPTHGVNGVTFNGSTQYANTRLDMALEALTTVNNTHLSMYVRTEGGTNDYDMGGEGQTTGVTRLIVNVGGSMYAGINDNGNSTGASPATRKGHYTSSRTGSAGYKVFRNGVELFNKTQASTATLVTNKILIGANSSGSEAAVTFSPKQFAFASIGSGLSDAECLSYYNAVQSFQTTLGRNV